jgi:hypothetical protein
MATGSVYRLVNTESKDTIYVGSTIKSLKERWISHKLCCEDEKSREYSYAVYKGWRKLGFENVKMYKIKEYENIDVDELMEKEQKYIDKYNPLFNKYKTIRNKEYKKKINTKTCKDCKETKSIDEFCFGRKLCLDCRKIYSQSYYIKNKEKWIIK